MVHADPGIPCLIGNRVTVGPPGDPSRLRRRGRVLDRHGGDPAQPGEGGNGLRDRRGALLLEGMEVPPGSLVVGSPAKVLRPVDEKARCGSTTSGGTTSTTPGDTVGEFPTSVSPARG